MSARDSIPQASPDQPHWVVVSLGKSNDVPVEIKHSSAHHKQNWRRLFRHPSEELAFEECARLAALAPGTRFQVYASRGSCKIEREPAEAAA